MRILFWSTAYFPCIGGLEKMTHGLVKQLQKLGHEVVVITDNPENGSIESILFDNVAVHRFPFRHALYYKDLKAIRTTFDNISKLWESFCPNVVSIHGWHENFAFYQTRTLTKHPTCTCLTVHGLLEQAHYQTQSCIKLWSMASAVNTVSQALISGLQYYGFRHPKLQTIYNAVPNPSEPTLPLPTDQPRLLMIGRLSEEKCFDVGFHAIAQLITTHPDIELTLVGGGTLFHQLDNLRKSLGLEKHIHMTDFIQPAQVTAYIDQANLVLIPSYYESFCLVAAEAASRARPVIASNVHGLKEVVVHQETGILIPPKDASALAHAIDALLSEPEKMHSMGQAAQDRINTHFTIEGTTRQYVDMFTSALETEHA